MNKFLKISLSGLLGLVAIAGLASCDSKKPADNLNPVEELKLTKKFETKDFLDDGIQEVSVDRVSDGDTATMNGYIIRFAGVNTPESTGQIEKWGKAASNFTKGKLTDAKSVVIEGTNGIGNAPSTEGTGGRYLGFVWYQPSNSDRYYNLNLELVYNGYSDSTLSSDAEYYDYFERANKRASEESLNIHSQADDPLYFTKIEKMDIQTIAADPEKYDQHLVEVEAYIKARNGNEIIIAQVLEGKEHEFSIYLGYETFPNEIVRVGNKVRFVARVNSHYDKWQLSGLVCDLFDTANSSEVLLEGYRFTFGKALDMNYSFSALNVQTVKTEGDFVYATGFTANNGIKGVTVTVKIPKAFATGIVAGKPLKCVAYNTSNTSIMPGTKTMSLEVLNASDILK